MQRIIAASIESQLTPESHDSKLTPETKRLMLSAHLGLVFKKLHRGLCVEEQELLQLLPFTVPNGWRPDSAAREEFAEPLSPSDADWTHRVAEASALS